MRRSDRDAAPLPLPQDAMMTSIPPDSIPQPAAASTPAQGTVPQLVAATYENAPPAVRARFIEHLLQPLGVLSLVAIADGVFARMRFRAGWPDVSILPQDLDRVSGADVRALVDFVEQVGTEIVDGLAQVISASPALAGSAAAAVLVSVLLARMHRRLRANAVPNGRGAGR